MRESIERKWIFEAQPCRAFELLFTDEAARKYPRVDATWIMDHAPEQTGKAPSILADYAVPRRDR